MGNVSHGEDVAHQVWLKVAQHVRDVGTGTKEPLELKYELSLKKWLSAIVFSTAKDAQRSRGRTAWDPLEDDDLSYLPNLGERLEDAEQKKAVRAAFKKIGETCQELLLLLIQDPPLEYREIAQAWGRPVGSIGPTRERCIRQLRAAMGMET